MNWNKTLDILLVCDYNVEKTLFLEKIGSGDYYRQLLNELIEEVDVDNLGRKYFQLIDKDVSNEKAKGLSKKRKEKLHRDCIEYYIYKTNNYDMSNLMFEQYATRYMNLIGHYFALELFDEAALVLEKIGLYLYKWGYSGYLLNILKRFNKSKLPIIAKKLNTLYLLDSLQASEKEEKDISETLELCGLSIIDELNMDSQDINDFIGRSLNIENELSRLIAYLYLEYLKFSKDLIITNKNIELFTSEAELYFMLLCDDEQSSSSYQHSFMSDPYFDKLYLTMQFKKAFKNDDKVEQVSKMFIQAHQATRLLNFNVTMLYVDLVLGFLQMLPGKEAENDIIEICKAILENKQIKSYIQGNRLIKNINAFHSGNVKMIEIPSGKTKLDLIFDAYKSQCKIKSMLRQ